MTLNLPLTGFDPNNPVPGTYAEIRFSQGETAGDLGSKRVLIIGTRTSAGSAAIGTQVYGPFTDEADFITYAGTGSVGHRMGRAFLSICKTVELYYIAPTLSTGVAAVDEITFATAPTGSGVAIVYICGEPCAYAFTASDTVTTIAAGLKLAINSKPWLPVTADNSAGVLTMTAVAVGSQYNTIRFKASVTAGKGTTCTVTTEIPLGTSGAGGYVLGTLDPTYTTALATILGKKFHYIVPDVQTSTPLLALLNQVSTQAEPTTGFRQKVIVAGALTHAAAATLASGASLNNARFRFFNCQGGFEEHYVHAAKLAAAIVKEEIADPSYNFDGYGTKSGQNLPITRPTNDSDIPTATQMATMLKSGVSPIGTASNGTAYIVRSITTRCLNGSIYDYRARDSIVVTVGDKFLDDLVAKLANAPWTKATANPAAGGPEPGAAFATPQRVKALVETLVSDYVDAGYLDPAKKATILSSMQVGIDPVLSSRINIVIPIYSAVLLHQFGVLGKESSPAN